jgi:hypothetical protein
MKNSRNIVFFLLLAGINLAFFACGPATVTSVSVSPATVNVPKGGNKTFTAAVTGTNNPEQAVTWKIVETNKNSGTTINASGLLNIAADEALTSLTVEATSTADTTKSGTAKVTVTPPPTVSTVTVSPSTASVAKGGTQAFTATVTGTYSPAQTVTWSVTGGITGTSITNGTLTVASGETAATLTVKATSTVDATKSGTATVTVTSGIGEVLNTSSQEQVTKKLFGYDYELWNEKKQGNASMTLPASTNSENGGVFTCEWDGINNVLFRAGKKYNKTQTHSQIGTFSIDYIASVFNPGTASGKRNAYLSVYGWVSGGSPDALIEYYIIEAKGEYDPGTGGTQVGPTAGVTIDGGTYKLYKVQKTNAPSIEGNKNFIQYFSIRTSNRTSGTISVSEHFKAWADAGLTSINNGKLYEVALKVESYGGPSGNAGGNATITKNILKVNGTPIQ